MSDFPITARVVIIGGGELSEFRGLLGCDEHAALLTRNVPHAGR